MTEPLGTQMRLDIKGQPFYFYIEADNPYTAMRLALDYLESQKLPCPSIVKIQKVSAGDYTHQVEAFWALCDRTVGYKATLVTMRRQILEERKI